MPAAVAQRRKGAALSAPSAKKARHAGPAAANGKPASKSGLAALVSSDDAAGKRASAATTNGVKSTKNDKADESRAVVGHGDVDMTDADPAVVEISSAEEDSELDDSGDENEGEAADTKTGATDIAMADGTADEETAVDEAEPPSFGELLQANAPEVVDVEATFQGPNAESRALAPVNGNRTLSAPSATSLGTVLTQALKTNDKELLESCFEMNDLNSVRSTIERLPSSLVANLLRRLAERLHKRPGRAGNLMVWVQWSIVSHGGYLAGRQDIMRELGSLNRVIKERASGLQPLLTLKGKLDMLSAQLELRRSMQKAATMDEDDEDEGVIYVEGQDESDSDEDAAVGTPKAITDGKSQKRSRKDGNLDEEDDLEGAESSDDDDGAMNLNAEEDEDEGGSEEDEDVLDDEAEETDNDSGDDASEDEFELESDGEDLSESDIETPRPTKRSAAAQRMGFGSGRRRR